MPASLFNPSILVGYLNGFRAVPDTGEMMVPFVQRVVEGCSEGTGGDNRQPLPKPLRPLWSWVLSDESEPKENDWERYYETTKRTYAPYLR